MSSRLTRYTERMFDAITLTWGLVSEPRTYLTFLKLKKWQLMRFYALAVLFLSALWSGRVVMQDLPMAQNQLNQAADEFTAHYPDDLLLDWNGQQLTLNPSLEYTIYYPSFINPSELELPGILAIYQPIDVAENQPSKIDTFFLITPSTIWVQDQQQGWSSMQLAELLEGFPSANLTKTQLATNLETWINNLDLWHLARLTTIVFSFWWMVGTTLVRGVVQYILAYLVLIKIYNVKLTGQQLARLTLPITMMASTIQGIAEVLYTNTQFDLFIITFWILLFLVTQAWIITSKQRA